VAGDVTNDGILGAGNALAPLTAGPVGRFTLGGNLTNAGALDIASSGAPGNTLVVSGNAAAAPGATLDVATVLNAGGALSNQFTDRLLVNGDATGVTTINVRASGTGAFTGTDAAANSGGISLVQVGGASDAGAFVLAGGTVTGNTPFTYQLYAFGPGAASGPADAAQSLVGNGGQNWDYRLENVFVTPAGPVAPVLGAVLPPLARPAVAPQVAAYISAPEALFNAGFEDVDELHRRLGEISADDLAGDGKANQGFARVFGSSFNYASTRGFADYGYNMSGDETAVQFGATHRVLDDADGTLRVGLAGTLGNLWYKPSAVDGPSQGTLATQTIAGTATWQARSGWYVDGILSAGLFNGHVSTAAGRASGLNGSSVTGSVETGMPLALGNSGLVAEPEAQLVYEHLDFANKTDRQGFAVALGSPDEGLLRVGGRLKRDLPLGGGGVLTPYGEFNLLQGLGGSNQVRLGQVAFTTGGYGTAVQLRAGLTGRVSQSLSLYGDVARTQAVGNSGFRGWGVNAGMKVAF
jgi:outer membrane autotransporter protein